MRFIRKTHYKQDIQLFKHEGQVFWYGLLAAGLLAAPFLLSDFYLGELSLVFIYAIAGIGLMLLTGYTGLVSLGHAAFLAIGAYTHAYLLAQGWPFLLSATTATLVTALIGGIVGIPALRMTGIYLAVATLAFAIIVEQVLVHWESVTGGFRGMAVELPSIGALALDGSFNFYFLCLAVLVVSSWLALNLLRSPTGRAMTAIRDSEISAQSMGIHLAYTKTTAFAISAGFTGLAGSLLAHKIGYLAPDSFTLLTSIQLLLMVVVGGLGSLHGVIYGAIFIGFLPQGIAVLRDTLPSGIAQIPGLEPGIFGLILVLVLIYEPLGIYGRWLKIRSYFEAFPLYRKAMHKRQRSYLRTERLR
ncbi:MAG: branched-chain amino acid ABC transporter permease [Pseudomonadales bacterium]|nr:branched-chain amino acid ABC transporter permease [Pseudomonadales bacterium]MBO6596174.1 branched-chain amino acid ABC transporter permease [Pseudomonadales bacterium]MBO6822654.1 branched-chain amino acid ABC transporter permease [Pseudomonadales bacterium]